MQAVGLELSPALGRLRCIPRAQQVVYVPRTTRLDSPHHIVCICVWGGYRPDSPPVAFYAINVASMFAELYVYRRLFVCGVDMSC